MNGFVYENLFPNTGMSITNIFCQATEKKKTKQNKKILSLSAQCFGFSVYSYPTRCCFRYAIKKRSSILKLSRGNWCLWLGEVQVNQPKRLGYYNISTTNLIVFSVLRRQSSRNRSGEQRLHGVTVENVFYPLNAVLYCCNFNCVGVKQPTSDQR